MSIISKKKIVHQSIFTALLQCALISTCLLSNQAFAECSNCEIKDALQNMNSSINNNHTKMITLFRDYFVTGLTNENATPDGPDFSLLGNYPKKFEIDIVGTNKRSLENTNAISANLISYYLAGIGTNQANSAGLASKLSNNEKNIPTITKYNDIFATSKQDKSTKQDGQKDNRDETVSDIVAHMNMDTLLAPRQYNPAQQEKAQLLIRNLENISPIPDIIDLNKNTILIPYGSSTKLIKVRNESERTELQTILKINPAYQKYSIAYHSAIAARSISMNNLLQLYQERVPTADNNGNITSSTAADYKSATWRLEKDKTNNKPSYMEDINKASPITVSRESLQLLALIHNDLYKLSQQNEKLIAMQSLNLLQSNQLSSLANKETIKTVATVINCWDNAKKNEDNSKRDPACKGDGYMDFDSSSAQ